jgi:hypothetical protein
MLLARRHPDLVRGLVVQATRSTGSTRAATAPGRSCPWPGRGCARSYRRYLNRAVPRLLGVRRRGPVVDHPVQPYIPWLLSEMSRNDPFVMVEAGRALADYDARSWAGSLGVPAAMLITTGDRLVAPHQQRALADVLGATTRELVADHFATLTHPGGVRRPDDGADRGGPSAGVRAGVLRRGLSVAQRLHPPVERLDRGLEAGELLPELVARDGVREQQPDAGDLAGEELGVGPGAFGDAPVELGLDAVARLLAVLGQQDQRRGVRRLQRQDQRQQDETTVPRVELRGARQQQVVGDPDDDDERLPDENRAVPR